MKIERILVAVDFSGHSEAALKLALNLVGITFRSGNRSSVRPICR